MNRFRIGLIILFYLTAIDCSYGQYSLEGFSLGDSSIFWYDQQIGEYGSNVYTGSYHQMERKSSESHSYWNAPSWQEGTLHYRGELFTGIPLIYDLENDIVITVNQKHAEFSQQPIRLIQQQIKWFEVDGSKFEYLPDSMTNMVSGFFKIVYAGQVFSIYEKLSKSLEFEGRRSIYEEDTQFYLKTDSEFKKIVSASSVAKYYKAQKNEIKAIARRRGLRGFKAAPDLWINEFGTQVEQILSDN